MLRNPRERQTPIQRLPRLSAFLGPRPAFFLGMHPSLPALGRACAISALLWTSACHQEKVAAKGSPPDKPAPSAQAKAEAEENLRIARNAMPVSEVLAHLRSGMPKEQVLVEVRTRHVASLIVPKDELELAANGAGHVLLAAMKDPQNLLTPAQESSYIQLVAERQKRSPATKKSS